MTAGKVALRAESNAEIFIELNSFFSQCATPLRTLDRWYQNPPLPRKTRRLKRGHWRTASKIHLPEASRQFASPVIENRLPSPIPHSPFVFHRHRSIFDFSREYVDNANFGFLCGGYPANVLPRHGKYF